MTLPKIRTTEDETKEEGPEGAKLNRSNTGDDLGVCQGSAYKASLYRPSARLRKEFITRACGRVSIWRPSGSQQQGKPSQSNSAAPSNGNDSHRTNHNINSTSAYGGCCAAGGREEVLLRFQLATEG